MLWKSDISTRVRDVGVLECSGILYTCWFWVFFFVAQDCFVFPCLPMTSVYYLFIVFRQTWGCLNGALYLTKQAYKCFDHVWMVLSPLKNSHLNFMDRESQWRQGGQRTNRSNSPWSYLRKTALIAMPSPPPISVYLSSKCQIKPLLVLTLFESILSCPTKYGCTLISCSQQSCHSGRIIRIKSGFKKKIINFGFLL